MFTVLDPRFLAKYTPKCMMFVHVLVDQRFRCGKCLGENCHGQVHWKLYCDAEKMMSQYWPALAVQ